MLDFFRVPQIFQALNQGKHKIITPIRAHCHFLRHYLQYGYPFKVGASYDLVKESH